MQQFYHRARVTEKDAEGSVTVSYGEPKAFSGEIWAGNGRVQAEIYAEKLSYIRNVRIMGSYEITEGQDGATHYVYPDGLDLVESDGLCLYVEGTADPDYKISAIKPYRNLVLEAMKL